MTSQFYPKLFQAVLKMGEGYTKGSSEQKVIRKTLNWMIREYQGPYKLYASKKAIELAKKEKLEKDLKEYSWHDQIKSRKNGGMGDKGRKLFYREHLYPISRLIDDLLAVDPEDIASVEDVLGNISIAWITKEQQCILDKGSKTDREEDALNFCIRKLNDEFDEPTIVAKDTSFIEEKIK